MAFGRSHFQFSSRTASGKILPVHQNEKAFVIAINDPVTFAKRDLRGVVVNTGDNDLTFTPQHAESEDGPWTSLASTTVKARAEATVQFSLPGPSTHWRALGAGNTTGILELVSGDVTHHVGQP